MPSTNSEFKLINRGYTRTMALIPGWATDYRIFNNLSLPYDYLLPVKLSPPDCAEKLLLFLNHYRIKTVTLFGWSFGGILAADFAARHPGRVNELFLLNVRDKFIPTELARVKQQLSQNPHSFLYKFYLSCFSPPDITGRAWFRKNLLPTYLKEMNSAKLQLNLDYLTQAAINPAALWKIKKIVFFHGQQDKIIPIKEGQKIQAQLPRSEWVSFPTLGHLIFLNRLFTEKFTNE